MDFQNDIRGIEKLVEKRLSMNIEKNGGGSVSLKNKKPIKHLIDMNPTSERIRQLQAIVQDFVLKKAGKNKKRNSHRSM